MTKNLLRFRRISKDDRTQELKHVPANQYYSASQKGNGRLKYRPLPLGSRPKNHRWRQWSPARRHRAERPCGATLRSHNSTFFHGQRPWSNATGTIPNWNLSIVDRLERKLPPHREELPGDEDIITGSAFLPAWAGLPADLPVDRQIVLTISLSCSCA